MGARRAWAPQPHIVTSDGAEGLKTGGQARIARCATHVDKSYSRTEKKQPPRFKLFSINDLFIME
jgi:hypothetical protein